MSPFRPFHFGRIVLATFGVLVFSGGPIQPSFAVESGPAPTGPAGATAEGNVAKNLARMNCGATIDCITPDGRLVAVPNASEKNSSAAALIMDDDTLSCPLQEGETTFIISFPKTSLLDRFTFVNENAAVQGEMRIAVSNYRLPADSPKWTDVSGKTEFTSKRLFNLSMVGVEARYVKLSFRVANTLATHRIEDMLNFNFANLYAKGHIAFGQFRCTRRHAFRPSS